MFETTTQPLSFLLVINIPLLFSIITIVIPLSFHYHDEYSLLLLYTVIIN